MEKYCLPKNCILILCFFFFSCFLFPVKELDCNEPVNVEISTDSDSDDYSSTELLKKDLEKSRKLARNDLELYDRLAIKDGNKKLVIIGYSEILNKNSVSPNYPAPSNKEKIEYEFNPLHGAIKNDSKDFKKIKMLLDLGAQITFQDHLGRNPIHYLILNKNVEEGFQLSAIILPHANRNNLILSLGQPDNMNSTPFNYAQEYKKKSVIVPFICKLAKCLKKREKFPRNIELPVIAKSAERLANDLSLGYKDKYSETITNLKELSRRYKRKLKKSKFLSKEEKAKIKKIEKKNKKQRFKSLEKNKN